MADAENDLNRLTEEQVDSFRRDGFVVVRRMIDLDQVKELLRDYERAVRGEIHVPKFGEIPEGVQVIQLASPSRHIPVWQEHAYFRNARAISRQLLGDDLDYFYDQIIFKPPRTPGETHWHQDAAYWTEGPANERAVTCWLSLGESFLENGGMQFVPGSHLGPVREHHPLMEDATIHNELATERVSDEVKVFASRLEPGDATFHHCRTLHYTGNNRSDVPRHGLVTHFAPKVNTETP
jgi:ectoine hydroxylase-related dioxygenase (phytanoyl-CoA dioxygenase family)